MVEFTHGSEASDPESYAMMEGHSGAASDQDTPVSCGLDEAGRAPRALVRHCSGVCLIVLVACIWVAASQLIEMIFEDMAFDKPYFLTYFNTCGFSLWLTGLFIFGSWRRQLSERFSRSSVEQSLAQGGTCSRRRGMRTYIAVALSICPGWMMANYLFNVSLDCTSVASNSVLSTTSNLWTMLFSVCFLGERVNPCKFAAVGVTVSGAALVATADMRASSGQAAGSSGSWSGDLLALTSACIYGIYTVQLKYFVPDNIEEAEAMSMPLVFGFIGLIVLLGGWPILWLLDITGVEHFEWPHLHVIGFLVLNASIGTNLSDVLWARALQLTTPLVATLGLSLTIPIGMISDRVLRGKTFNATYVAGAMLVLTGFTLGSTAERAWVCLADLWRLRRLRLSTCSVALSPNSVSEHS